MNILTLKEEARLSLDELDSYYNELCQCAKNRKLTNVTRGATTIAPKLKWITNAVADKLMDVLAGGAVEKYQTVRRIFQMDQLFLRTLIREFLIIFPGFQ